MIFSLLAVQRYSKSVKSSNMKMYTYNDLCIATRKFHADAELWKDGNCTIYKGYFDEKTYAVAKWGTGLVTAIKMFKDSEADIQGYLTEFLTLQKLCHPNIVKVIGLCLDNKEPFLVHEYPPHGRLHWHLFETGDSDSESLSWKLRISIAHGAAKGLAYLHSPEVNVIHCDVRTSNILIDSKYNSKLSGFCCSTNGPEDERSHVTTFVRGTDGYLDPAYVNTGHLTMKSDVFSFGVVLLELLTGRRPVFEFETENTSLAYWAQSRLSKEHGILDIMDAHLEGQYTVGAASTASSLALRCTSVDTKSRPDAKQVAEELEQLLSLINLEVNENDLSKPTAR